MGDFYCDEVLNGRTPVSKLVETDVVLAFQHTRPHWPVHIVVVPKRHVNSLLDLSADDNELLIELIDAVKHVAARVNEQYGSCRILTNLGEYQDSKHLHWHVSSGAPLR